MSIGGLIFDCSGHERPIDAPDHVANRIYASPYGMRWSGLQQMLLVKSTSSPRLDCVSSY